MKNLYNNLVNLCNNGEGNFFFKDQYTSFGNHMRVFSYHIAGLTSWMQPDALECRGIMFEMKNGEPVRIASRPMEKFFNLAERTAWNLTDYEYSSLNKPVLEYDQIDRYEDKADGSLMSSYSFKDPESDRVNYMLKSKTSLHSDQANDANRWLYNHEDLLNFIQDCEDAGYTVNLEWCSPKNQIVIAYEEESLKILNVRNRESGEYYPNSDLVRIPVFRKYSVDQFMFSEDTDVETRVKSMYEETGIEGYVLVFKDGSRVKVKTHAYCLLHKTKDSITNNKDLVCAVANGTSDDLRQLFIDDTLSLTKIREFEDHVVSEISNTLAKLKAEYKKVEGRERKDFAIAMQDAFKEDRQYFGIAMKMFQSGSVTVDQIVEVVCKYPELYVPVKWRS